MKYGKTISFADVTETAVSFHTDIPAHAIALQLIDSKWFQRLRDISQTANTRLVYMFSEHSRFGHSIGVCNLANQLMDKLSKRYADQIEPYAVAVSAAALLHDIGHLAPGSHTAFKTWFPDLEDSHESIATRILGSDEELLSICNRFGSDTTATIQKILEESDSLPPWVWEIISGGGWNVDRGNWCLVDSIMAGVSYGRYNVSALTDSMVISHDKHLAFEENRLDSMMHFALSRHAMYRQIYQHRVLLAADTLNVALARRARELKDKLPFADTVMQNVLDATTPEALSLETIFAMRESWWRYHLSHWQHAHDPIIADLSQRLLYRKLLKTIRIHETDNEEALYKLAASTAASLGYDPSYYVHTITTSNMNLSDYKQSMSVLMEDGRKRHLADAEPLFGAMAKESGAQRKNWLVVPAEVKEKIGRDR